MAAFNNTENDANRVERNSHQKYFLSTQTLIKVATVKSCKSISTIRNNSCL